MVRDGYDSCGSSRRHNGHSIRFMLPTADVTPPPPTVTVELMGREVLTTGTELVDPLDVFLRRDEYRRTLSIAGWLSNPEWWLDEGTGTAGISTLVDTFSTLLDTFSTLVDTFSTLLDTLLLLFSWWWLAPSDWVVDWVLTIVDLVPLCNLLPPLLDLFPFHLPPLEAIDLLPEEEDDFEVFDSIVSNLWIVCMISEWLVLLFPIDNQHTGMNWSFLRFQCIVSRFPEDEA